MEPLSVLGAAGSIVGIIDVASRCIDSLHTLQQRWKDADLTMTILIGQVGTLKAALGQVVECIVTNLDTTPQHHQLVADLEVALQCCRLSMAVIDEHISSLETNEYKQSPCYDAGQESARLCKSSEYSDSSPQSFVDRDELVSLIHSHSGTTQLTACSRTLAEQQAVIAANRTGRIGDRVRDTSSSLICLRDSASFQSSRTCSTERASLWSLTFGFDGDLLASRLYRRNIRSIMKRLTRPPRPLGPMCSAKFRLNQRKSWTKGYATSRILLIGPDERSKTVILDRCRGLKILRRKIKGTADTVIKLPTMYVGLCRNFSDTRKLMSCPSVMADSRIRQNSGNKWN